MKIKTILLADDEEPVRALVAATIRDDSRYKILEAKDGMEALEIARKEKPDIILLDIMMPKMDGFEVCRQLKSDPRTSGISIIMLTALAQNTDKGKAKEVGANGYFAKPFSPTALIKKLEEVLGS
ncbi:MAG: response regulator receiver protein [Dehalococcoidia bacterium]|nr:response regulator receiver protein [Dehalococcoidia bacterium]